MFYNPLMGVYLTVVPGLVKVRATKRGLRWALGPRWLRYHTGAGGRGLSTGAGPFSYYKGLNRGRRQQRQYHSR